MTALMLNLEGGAPSSKEDGDTLAQIAKVNIWYCCGPNRRRDKRLILKSWNNEKFAFAAKNLIFTLDLKTINSILDGVCLCIGDYWIEQRPRPGRSPRQ